MNFENIQLGIAPINWTNDDMPELGAENTFEQCISEMALAGYTGCEVGNKFPRNVHELKKPCIARTAYMQPVEQLQATSKSLEENKKNFTQLLDFLEAMGAKVIGGGETGNSCQGKKDVPVLEGKGMLSTENDWKKFTYGLNELGKIAKDRGMKLSFHHHMGTCIQTAAETERMLNETDAENVWLNYDCGHFYFAEDPVAASRNLFLHSAYTS